MQSWSLMWVTPFLAIDIAVFVSVLSTIVFDYILWYKLDQYHIMFFKIARSVRLKHAFHRFLSLFLTSVL